MSCKNCNTVLFWLAGGLVALSFVFPHGVPAPSVPQPQPSVPADESVAPDDKLATILRAATSAERNRVNGVYSALATVLERDRAKGHWITTTEQWAELQSRTLDLAVDAPGKYPGLDEAIEAVFLAQVGTDDVLPGNADTYQKLITACRIVAASAK